MTQPRTQSAAGFDARPGPSSDTSPGRLSPRRSPAPWPAYKRVPPFVPVPVRARKDGWDAMRQGQFIGWLAQTGSVAQAAARVGRSRESAHRLRRRADAAGFADAWDAVLAARADGIMIPARKVTPDELPVLAFDGPVRVRMYRGRLAAVTRQPSDTALLRFVAQCDRACRAGDRGGWP